MSFNANAPAISLAGHWGLDNLILIYDNNNVTVDGSIDSCFTDDTSAKFRAQNWHVIDVYDGSNDVSIGRSSDETSPADYTARRYRERLCRGQEGQGKADDAQHPDNHWYRIQEPKQW